MISTIDEAPCYVVFSTPLLPRPSQPKYPPQHPILENPQSMLLPGNRSACQYIVQGGSNMTGTNCDLFTHNQSRSYLNHLVLSSES